jgi:hypothetical protein
MLGRFDIRIISQVALLLVLVTAVGWVPESAQPHECDHHHCCNGACLCACRHFSSATITDTESYALLIPSNEPLPSSDAPFAPLHLTTAIFHPPETV